MAKRELRRPSDGGPAWHDRYATDIRRPRQEESYTEGRGYGEFGQFGEEDRSHLMGAPRLENRRYPEFERSGGDLGYGDVGSAYPREQGGDWYRPGFGRRYGPHIGKGPKGYRRPDSRIHEEICEKLTDHPYIDASEIEIEIKEGEVTLSGNVPDRRMKRLAEDIAADVSGVVDVQNRLRIQIPGVTDKNTKMAA